MAVKSRFCRVCGEPFQAKRFDALTCTSTCRMRRHRGQDLVYLDTMPAALAGARRFVHEAHRGAIATARAIRASRCEGRSQRRGLPKVRPMKIRTAAMAS
jgi:hypothetical protein